MLHVEYRWIKLNKVGWHRKSTKKRSTLFFFCRTGMTQELCRYSNLFAFQCEQNAETLSIFYISFW